ncbi:hypothetical protein BKA66DRAFT_560704 [Pyrenochaeta sp. MPI-SDFR-AT-0127]|nr:hypothetical protein BKA66DRAFT_560704 [Pyrenochaeta sp. MPI-SDFR-AT-0127]
MFTFAIVPLALAPIHLLAFSTLLGTELYQSFVMTKLAYQALPRSAFTSLQKTVFPVYFRSQSLLLLLVSATVPPHGPMSMINDRGNWSSFGVAGVTAGLNLLVYGPKTKNLMIERIHQATRDANLQLGAGMVSDEMKKLNRSFSKAHAMSIHLNLLTIGATLWWGWRLASKLRFDVE